MCNVDESEDLGHNSFQNLVHHKIELSIEMLLYRWSAHHSHQHHHHHHHRYDYGLEHIARHSQTRMVVRVLFVLSPIKLINYVSPSHATYVLLVTAAAVRSRDCVGTLRPIAAWGCGHWSTSASHRDLDTIL